jgi:Cu+-exporting ATPase
VTDVIPADGASADVLVRIAASAERLSEHPIGRAIVQHVDQAGIATTDATSFASETGRGVRACVNGETTLAGSAELMESEKISLDALHDAAERLSLEGKTPVFVAHAGRALGIVAVADRIRDSSAAAIERLRREKLEVVMLTGDNPRTAASIAKQAGVESVVAGVLPDGKVAEVARRQREGHVVAMVGDGINDAPALAQADVGIAMAGSTSTDIAIDASDVTLMRADLGGVANAIALSRRTMRTMRENLFWAFVYNVVGIPVAAGVLYPAFGVLLSPVLASAAMAVSSVSVVTNSLRLRRAGPAA